MDLESGLVERRLPSDSCKQRLELIAVSNQQVGGLIYPPDG